MKSDFRPKHLQCEFRLIPLTYNFMIGWIKKTLQKSQVRDNWPSINWAHYDDICAVELFCCRQDFVTLPYPSLVSLDAITKNTLDKIFVSFKIQCLK